MRLFITGGAGFIGSNFARRMLNQGHEVTVFDALTYAGNRSTIQDLEDNSAFAFVEGDIRDGAALAKAMPDHDAVVHFAAESHVDRSITGPHDFVTTNCLGTSMVMEAARDFGIERVIHISTDEVYGTIDTGSWDESQPVAPRSPYSASKAGSDLIALSYFTTYDVPVLVTRSSNNFGPWQYPEKVIPLFVTNLLDGKKVPLYGDGGNVRDWCHVEDNCAALETVLMKGTAGEIYNIGGGNEISNLELTHRVLTILGVDENMIQPVEDRLGHDRRYSVDCTKIGSLGWNPNKDFDRQLEDTVSWYRENRWWWEPLKSGTR